MGHLQNINSFETSTGSGNLQRYSEQGIAKTVRAEGHPVQFTFIEADIRVFEVRITHVLV